MEWQREIYDAGYAGISWPRGYGGRGASLMEQLIWYEESARSGARDPRRPVRRSQPRRSDAIARGNEEQKPTTCRRSSRAR